ncbi:glycosyltransferase [Qipengyuania spongiae]|uniref:Glycosyltransferase n=1 Tax=Qipengyuania spongiae TaxID=2909673 RepID=A0ABY5T240_9SPHN|nr:glycosyltransferase [Qipengyuania spongiae]UVI40853.1 glycosyltransferase [Qipengyuania spongiae]
MQTMQCQTPDHGLAGRSILALTRYGSLGASSRLRFHQYADYLRAAGAEITFQALLDDDYVAGLYSGHKANKFRIMGSYLSRLHTLLTARPDLLWVEKELFPYLPGAIEGLVARRGLKLAVDYDDAIFHGWDQTPWRRRLLGRKLDPLLAHANVVTVGNDYLAAYACQHGAARVEWLPTVVDTERYPVNDRSKEDIIKIGWIGSPVTAHFLPPVILALNALKNELPVRLITIGAGPLEGIEIQHDAFPWSEETEGQLVSGLDIGVMPLDDSLFARGKCGYKLIQYMAAGRPVIASPVGVNNQIVTQEVGRLATTTDEWISAIRELASAPVLRRRMGQAARERVEKHYSLAAAAPRLARLLGEAIAA